MSNSQSERIVAKPGVCGGRPCIAGTRVRVQDIYVWHELQGTSADEIVSRFPQLSMADVYAALTYYWDHRDDILRDMRDEAAYIEQMKATHPSPLNHKLAEQNAAHHPVSP